MVTLANNQATLLNQEAIKEAIIDFEIHRCKKVYGELSEYNLKKIKREVSYYVENSIDSELHN